MSYFPTTISSGLRLLRRNAGRIALVTALAGGAYAAATYVRRQYNDLNDTLAQERRHGARSLRAAFTASSHTLASTFLALLPRIGVCIAGCAAADASPALTRLHERPTDRDEKTALWQAVRDASLTALLAAVYLSSTLHATLALQLHLLARYAAAPPDAPVQPLPAGPLRAPTSKRFLEASSKHVAGPARAATIVDAIAPKVRDAFADVPLAKPLPVADLHSKLLAVLREVADEERAPAEGGVHAALATDPLFRNADEGAVEGVNGHADTAAQNADDADAAAAGDPNLTWLVCEALDLCDVLAMDEVILAGASSSLAYAIGSVREDVAGAGADADALPFAQMLGKIAAAATRVTDVDAGANAVEMVLRDDETCRHFAAAVFLSGEKQDSHSGSGGRAFGGDAGEEVGLGGGGAVPGGSLDAGGSGDNLGLMFDMANGEAETR